MENGHEIIVPNEDLPFKMFLFEGELDFYLNDTVRSLNAGSFMLVNSNEIHAVNAVKPNQTVVVQIPLQTFSDYFTGEQYIRFTHEPTAQDTQVMHLIQEMYATYTEKAVGYDMKVNSGYYELLYLLVSGYREMGVRKELLKQNQKRNRLTTITSYIREHYKEEVSLESLAEIFGYAPAYLSRMFQKYAEINYKDYLQRVRAEYAFRELDHTDHTISEVAMNNGFPNSKAFAKAFQKQYGMLPSEYRRQKKKDKKVPLSG